MTTLSTFTLDWVYMATGLTILSAISRGIEDFGWASPRTLEVIMRAQNRLDECEREIALLTAALEALS